MNELQKLQEEMEVAKSAIRILLQHLREHEAKLNLFSDNVVILKGEHLTKLNGQN